MGSRRLIGIILFCSLFAVQMWVLIIFLEDRSYLVDLNDRLLESNLLPSEKVIRLQRFINKKTRVGNDNYFLHPELRFLRPTARQVAQSGGDCADRSRLLIRLLQLQGIRAKKWALYDKNLNPVHAVVEVEIENGTMVVDPLYGLFFPRPSEGSYYGVMDLKNDPHILPRRVQSLRALKESPPIIQKYPLEKYNYKNVRSINWNKLKITEWTYQILSILIGDRVNEISRPSIVESPALMVLWGIGGIQCGFLIVGFLYWKKRSYVR